MPPDPLLRLPDNVIADVLAYGNELERFKANQVSAVEFMTYAEHMGVYGQRAKGKFMVRVRLGAGALTPRQARMVAKLSQEHGDRMPHFTTRQNVQIHGVGLDDTARVQEGLLGVDLAAHGCGGNTVRNVRTPARAGVEPNEVFDVRPYAIATTEYLLRFHDSRELPRKFKIAFSGAGGDEILAATTDLGFLASKHEGKIGFRAFAGGGQGSSPRPGLLIRDWLEPGHVLHMAEAVKRVFERHGNRQNKHAARLRFVVKKFGEEEFVRLCRAELDEVILSGLPGNVPQSRAIPTPSSSQPQSAKDPRLLPDKTPGYYSIRLNLPLGIIKAEDLLRLANLVEDTPEGLIRVSCKQDLYISALPGNQALSLLDKVEALQGKQHSLITCVGASTCKFGLCLSRNLGSAITAALSAAGLDPTGPEIRVSGCPNSCSNHHASAIGLSAVARSVDGRKLPCYEVWAGAVFDARGATLAKRLGTVPARQVPAMLVAAYQQAKTSPTHLRAVVAQYARLPDPVPDEYFYDWGADVPFSLDRPRQGRCCAGGDNIDPEPKHAPGAGGCSCACSRTCGRDAGSALVP